MSFIASQRMKDIGIIAHMVTLQAALNGITCNPVDIRDELIVVWDRPEFCQCVCDVVLQVHPGIKLKLEAPINAIDKMTHLRVKFT